MKKNSLVCLGFLLSTTLVATSLLVHNEVFAEPVPSSPEGLNNPPVVPTAPFIVTIPITATATATATATSTVTTTPTITPTPTPTSQECAITRFNVNRANGDNQLEYTAGNDLSRLLDLAGLPPGFSCVSNLVNQAVACADSHRASRRNPYWDDALLFCVARPLFGDLRQDRGQSWYDSYLVPTAERATVVASKNAFCSKKTSIHPDFIRDARLERFQCSSGHVYFDKNCNPVPLNPDGTPRDPSLRACGNSTVHFNKSSPISLVWEYGADADVKVSLVNFPLDPAKGPDFYTWKASSKLPLVVWDPEHKGSITKAAQLFGNWTFGGNKTASLNNASASGVAPWKDGYEALGSLDQNMDGRISGSELRPLALWFDRNSNGISEEGEVQRISEVGVTALFFKADSYNDATKTIRASLGFERVLNGTVIQGASIDWFGGSSPSATRLVDGLLKNHYNQSVEVDPVPIAALPPEDDRPADTGKAVEDDGAWNGVWEWRLKSDATKPIADGYLMMGRRAEGGVRGFSLSPVYVAPATGDLSTILSMHGFVGSLEGQGANEKLTFVIKHGLSVLSTTVSRTGSEDELHGTSRVSAQVPGGSEEVSYEWVAKRRSSKEG